MKGGGAPPVDEQLDVGRDAEEDDVEGRWSFTSMEELEELLDEAGVPAALPFALSRFCSVL